MKVRYVEITVESWNRDRLTERASVEFIENYNGDALRAIYENIKERMEEGGGDES